MYVLVYRILGIALGLIVLMAVTSVLSTVMTRRIVQGTDVERPPAFSRWAIAQLEVYRIRLAADSKCLACVHKQLRTSACYTCRINESEFTQRDTFFRAGTAAGDQAKNQVPY